MVDEHDYTRDGLDAPDDPPVIPESDQFEEALSVSPMPQDLQDQITLDFSEAIKALAEGRKITRQEWKNEDYGLLRNGYVEINRNGIFHTWMINDGDLLATDWIVIPE